MARRRSFLSALLRGGAPVLASATSELSDEVADPRAPALPALRRVAGPVDAAARDGLLLRAARFVALIPIVYRLLAVPAAFAVFAGSGAPGLLPVSLVVACAVALSLFELGWLVRGAPFSPTVATRLLTLDVTFAIGANLVVAASVPESGLAPAGEVAVRYLLGTVALLTLALGVGYGAALALATVPLHLAMDWLGTGRVDVQAAFAGLGRLLGVLLTAVGALVLVGLGTRLALAYGIRTGRLAERAVQHRRLHDTVLQTLEAMALPGSGDAERLRRMARAEATALRRYLESDSGGESGPLAEKLGSLAAEMARDGLRAQLVLGELDDETLPEVRQLAVRDAVREAMRNTLKHAGTDRVLVRTEERDGGIATTIRDHGAGFSPEDRPPGFGISESIVARLTEVGGTATVDSSPGGGTRVTLWVPKD
ncbi:signal transduction histidine kinase [Prauserella shujinwangii]|uniref:Signal transduction histidine kinase n=1 Tax=Prauserella shujinwangii TaxID=1453103 RepID=A0A2T0LV64_9PSEU|nr:ATP-binding protein [Prauserella shujinwangii]PRX47697.1 signal transduction histidine kinase [Prauserella shujinwangii]